MPCCTRTYTHLIALQTWTATLSDGTRVPLAGPQGHPQSPVTPLTSANIPTYTAALVNPRLHQARSPPAAVRAGLARVVPAAVLPLPPRTELELQVCGR